MRLHVYALTFCNILDCPQVIFPNLKVSSLWYNYNADGKFVCSHGAQLFYTNETMRLFNQTKCLADASWDDQKNVDCWLGKMSCGILY